jgi:hypothetical protein
MEKAILVQAKRRNSQTTILESTMTTTLPEVVPGVFNSRKEAEAAIASLRELGLSEQDIGVIVPDPGRYQLMDHSVHEAFSGLKTGVAVGAPLGSLAGVALMALALPGVGVIGLGGLLVGVIGGAVWGGVVGGLNGVIARVRWNAGEAQWCEIPLGSDDILVVARAGSRAQEAYRRMEQHGGRCFLDQGSLDAAWREIEAEDAAAKS